MITLKCEFTNLCHTFWDGDSLKLITIKSKGTYCLQNGCTSTCCFVKIYIAGGYFTAHKSTITDGCQSREPLKGESVIKIIISSTKSWSKSILADCFQTGRLFIKYPTL